MIRVGQANVSIERREAFIGGRAVPLGTRAFDVLEKLIASPNRLVTKQELLDAAWPDVFVEENNLAVQIHALRRHLKLDRKMLETMPRRGYRLNVSPTCASALPPVEEGILEISYDESRGIISRVQGKEAIRSFLGALLGKVPEFEQHNVRFLINIPDRVLGE